MDPFTIALILLWAVVLALGIVVIALARQIGILFERVAPMGALMTDAGPKIGEASPKFALQALATGKPVSIGAASGRALLIFFLSPTCPVCKKLLPVLKSAQKAEKGWLDIVLASDGEAPRHEAFITSHKLDGFPYVLSSDLGMAYRVSRLPYGVVLDGEGTVRAKGLINNREQLESLFNAKEMGVASIQGFLDQVKEA
ncbi:methylamine dehydrogenase accessory protein MauD [Taklimakanibacter lacteus]|uniref:methylamine dehydrogenase accessory protein MauD n=1 Tax=Taklimakanibacter lacteus TaxID=2268456 RepID=UPI000E66C719